jgi:hypothetical protein
VGAAPAKVEFLDPVGEIDDDLANTDTARFGPEFLSLFKG